MADRKLREDGTFKLLEGGSFSLLQSSPDPPLPLLVKLVGNNPVQRAAVR